MKPTIYFTKTFTKGLLKGITINDSLSFATVEAASRWIKGIQAKCAANRLPFKIVDFSFQNYVR